MEYVAGGVHLWWTKIMKRLERICKCFCRNSTWGCGPIVLGYWRPFWSLWSWNVCPKKTPRTTNDGQIVLSSRSCCFKVFLQKACAWLHLLCGFVQTLPRIDSLLTLGGRSSFEPVWIVLASCSCSHLPCVGSREAARECRRKKKEYVKCLENRVAVLENQNKTLIEELKALKDLYCHKAE